VAAAAAAALEADPHVDHAQEYEFLAHISGLPESATLETIEADLRRAWSAACEVAAGRPEAAVIMSSEALLEVKLPIDSDTGLNKGFAFASLVGPEERDVFVALFRGAALCGSDSLGVERARPKITKPKPKKKKKVILSTFSMPLACI